MQLRIYNIMFITHSIYVYIYRHIKHELRQLKLLVPLRSDEGACPACLQVTSSSIQCISQSNGATVTVYIILYHACISTNCCIQSSNVYLSLDANFGLCRKKSAGNSVRNPLHNESLFLDQVEVNEFVTLSVDNYGSFTTTNLQVTTKIYIAYSYKL